jgi:hypothetical protein
MGQVSNPSPGRELVNTNIHRHTTTEEIDSRNSHCSDECKIIAQLEGKLHTIKSEKVNILTLPPYNWPIRKT